MRPSDRSRFFGRILDCGDISLRIVSLTGQLLSADAELTLRLGRAKSTMDRRPWVDIADAFSSCRRGYEAAWQRYEQLEPALRRNAVELQTLARDFESAVATLRELAASGEYE